jgi:transposase-like protein
MLEFKSLKDLLTKLSDEKVAREYVEDMRWGGNPVCPHCGAFKPYKLKDGKTYRCKDKTCKRDFTVLVGSIFENSKIPLSTWMAALYLLTGHKKGISSLQLGRDLGVTQKTAWFMTHRIRLIMGEPEPAPLECIVEVDETYVGGKFANMNRAKRKEMQKWGRDNKTAVMGMVQRDGKARLTVIGSNTFKDVVRDNVDNAAVIVTDTHLSYAGLGQEYAAHLTVNHSQSEYRNGLAFTNTVEGFFSSLKRSIYGIYHSVSPKHLHRYCEETSYRYNTRKISDKERFNITLQNTKGRLKYKNLIQKL